MKVITRTIWILSLVSMFADIASEMLYPVVPVYLKEIGFSVFLIGVLEGVAEFSAGISKGYFAKRSDEKGLRLPFVKGGYALSALSKPMMAVFRFPLWIFFARSIDRLGKGLRTGARDALLSAEATRETKGRVFGFHRALDTTGAVMGPAIALLFLHFFPGKYARLFYYAFIPGILSVLLIFLLKEKKQPVSSLRKGGFFSYFRYWKKAPLIYKKLAAGLLFFALFNSSDVFLILKTRQVTGNDTITIAAYLFYNTVFAVMAYPMGALADRLGFRNVLAAGLTLFAIVYAGFGLSSSVTVIFLLFFLYGLFAAATEGVAKAWITNISHDKDTATAIGFFTSGQSVCSLLASIAAGFIWSFWESRAVFFIASLAGISVVLYFLVNRQLNGYRSQ